MSQSASDTLRASDHYKRSTILAGLERCGFKVGEPPKRIPQPGDVLVIWNRWRTDEAIAARYEAAGARVIVVENGFIGADKRGHQLFAIALRNHLGAGQWNVGPEDRWSRLGIELAPWRTDGDEIVVLPQRGIGVRGVGMPDGWTDSIVSRLKRITKRPLRVRPHPGMSRTDPKDDLRHAWAAVTWASGAGIKSIVHGVPVFHEMGRWIGAPAAKFGIDDLENPFLGNRLPMLQRLAWAQWNLEEIRSGEAFRCLLQ